MTLKPDMSKVSLACRTSPGMRARVSLVRHRPPGPQSDARQRMPSTSTSIGSGMRGCIRFPLGLCKEALRWSMENLSGGTGPSTNVSIPLRFHPFWKRSQHIRQPAQYSNSS
ncbi:protein of unknown function [Rhodovastum atsumiense]|nr:protein of unknown function [Rhodovastum atsumiense]